MFERMTERSRQAIALAETEARAFDHDYIGTEHLLLGLLREEEGLAARVLESLDITVEEVREQVARIVGATSRRSPDQIPFTPRAKNVLDFAMREALSLGHNYVGTEHILLAIVRENGGVATRILLDFDADAEKIRNEIIRMLSGRRLTVKATEHSALLAILKAFAALEQCGHTDCLHCRADLYAAISRAREALTDIKEVSA